MAWQNLNVGKTRACLAIPRDVVGPLQVTLLLPTACTVLYCLCNVIVHSWPPHNFVPVNVSKKCPSVPHEALKAGSQ